LAEQQLSRKAKKVSTDYAKSLGGVDKAAKKAGGALASFDEINVLAQDAGGNEGYGDARRYRHV